MLEDSDKDDGKISNDAGSDSGDEGSNGGNESNGILEGDQAPKSAPSPSKLGYSQLVLYMGYITCYSLLLKDNELNGTTNVPQLVQKWLPNEECAEVLSEKLASPEKHRGPKLK